MAEVEQATKLSMDIWIAAAAHLGTPIDALNVVKHLPSRNATRRNTIIRAYRVLDCQLLRLHRL